jgi:rhodanese-related sulfurtransferase
MPKRVISAIPRVINAVLAFAPNPIPSEIPAPIAITFLTIAWFAVLFMTLFTFFKSATQKYRVITNPEAVHLMNNEEAVVIDLRPIDEFQRGHIIGSVNLLPTEIKNHNVGKIEHHKERPVIIVDVNGVSSTTSAELLTKQGFEKVYVLKDGLAAWAGANLPLVKKHK